MIPLTHEVMIPLLQFCVGVGCRLVRSGLCALGPDSPASSASCQAIAGPLGAVWDLEAVRNASGVQ